MKIDFRVQK